MLNDLIDHFLRTGNKSLMARIYGLYTLRSNVFSAVDFIVMQNTVNLRHQENSKIVFDLKGSTTNRLTKLPASQKKFWTTEMN